MFRMVCPVTKQRETAEAAIVKWRRDVTNENEKMPASSESGSPFQTLTHSYLERNYGLTQIEIS